MKRNVALGPGHQARIETRPARGLLNRGPAQQPRPVRRLTRQPGRRVHVDRVHQLAMTLLLFTTTWVVGLWVLPRLACLTGFDTFTVLMCVTWWPFLATLR